MKKTISSDSFQYKDVDYVIECDGGINSSVSKYVVGWTISHYPSPIVLTEGRAISENYSVSTVEAELMSIEIALDIVQEMKNEPHIILRTDFEGIIDDLNPNSKTFLTKTEPIKNKLDNFSGWIIEKSDRKDIMRPHRLASSVDPEMNYVPTVKKS